MSVSTIERNPQSILDGISLINVYEPTNITSSDTSVTIDISGYVPSGKHVYGIISPSLGHYVLPYINPNSHEPSTWVSEFSNTAVELKNLATWGTNYPFRAILCIK